MNMKAIVAILLSMVFGSPALAATFVYVSNADDGEIGTYALQSRLSQNRTAHQGGKNRDADGGEPGQALPHRSSAFAALPGIKLQHRPRLR